MDSNPSDGLMGANWPDAQICDYENLSDDTSANPIRYSLVVQARCEGITESVSKACLV